ncbi:MAG: hypothetical protein ACXW28_04850, partial [Thermoanaerobaculia bacterium]
MREAFRRHRFAFVFLAALVLVLFLPPLVKREVFTAIHIRDFVLPHWNPYSGSGEPWLANPQTGVFYPPTWLFIGLPFETAYMLYLALHLIVLGWGGYLLFARRVAPEAAFVGAVALTFAGPTLSLLDISNNLATFAWIPWILWAAVARLSPALAGLFMALAFLGGEPYFAAIGAGLYAVLTLLGSDVAPPLKAAKGRLESRPHVMQGGVISRFKPIFVAGATAAGLSAIQLVPFLEMVRGSDRASGLPAVEIFHESAAPRDWLRVAVPPQLNDAGFDPSLSQHFIPVIYVGIPIAILAVCAWIFVRRNDVIG